MCQGRLRYVVVRCGGRHLKLASTPSQTKIWEIFASKGDAEHRSIKFHHWGKMVDINLGYEIEWNSMISQLISENPHFLLYLLTKTLSCKIPAPLNECNISNKAFHRRCGSTAGKSSQCLTEKSARSRCVLTTACWCLNSTFTARLHVKPHKF